MSEPAGADSVSRKHLPLFSSKLALSPAHICSYSPGTRHASPPALRMPSLCNIPTKANCTPFSPQFLLTIHPPILLITQNIRVYLALHDFFLHISKNSKFKKQKHKQSWLYGNHKSNKISLPVTDPSSAGACRLSPCVAPVTSGGWIQLRSQGNRVEMWSPCTLSLYRVTATPTLMLSFSADSV